MDVRGFFDAIEAGNAACFRALLDAQPELAHARNENGVSALLFARYCSRQEMVDQLLPLNPDLDIFEAAALGKKQKVAEMISTDLNLVNAFAPDGFTALHYACFFGHPNIAELLLRYGADANARSRNATSVMPLHSATANVRKLKTVEWLVLYKADVNATQPGGFTPLHTAAAHGDAEIIDFLLSKGADPNKKDDNGRTPFELAKEKGHEQLVATLKAHA